LRDPSETRFRLFGSIARFLSNVSQRQPLVLVLDDLHWADVPSLRLLEFLAMEIADSRLLVVGTYRETEVSRRHRLSDTLGALARVPHILRLHLAGLNAEEVRRFVATTAGIVPPAWLTQAIHDQTEGNPLFVREVVRFLAQQGHFTAAAPATATAAATGTGTGTGIGTPPAIRLPEGVREVIGRRLNLLSATCNEILAVAAVIGREFTLDVLVRASQAQTEEIVLEALDEALSAHIVEETSPGLYQFTHALVRITLYDELRTGQRRHLHHTVGEAIESVHHRDPEPVLGDLAHHFRSSGLGSDVERAIDYAARAGRTADAALAYEDAVSFFQNALDALDSSSADDPARRCTLLFLLGEAQRKAADFPQSMETLRIAAAIARQRGMASMLAEVALAFANAGWRSDAPGSSPMLQEALDGLPESDAGLRIQLMGLLARDRLHSGAVTEAKSLAEKAVAMARVLGNPAVLATALKGMADFPWEPDETERLLADAIEMAEKAAQAGDMETVSQGYFRQVVHSLELGNTQDAIAAVEMMSRANQRLRQYVYTVFELALKSTLALLRGALNEAEQIIVQIVRLQTRNETHISDAVSMLIFSLRREQGRLRDLGPMVSAFVRANAAVAWRPALALLYTELGDETSARAVLNELAADDFASVPRDGRWTTCLVFLAEVCVMLEDHARSLLLYKLLLPWTERNIVMGSGSGCWGSADRFLGRLSRVMGYWLEAEHHLTLALAMNERTGAQAPLAHTHLDYAEMLLARGYPGDRAKAELHLRQAEECANTLGLIALAGRIAATRGLSGNPTPRSAVPDNLTVRELEVLRLMAIGRGNADIALVLEISLNTVATHVRNILAKTGCANRTEAAAYAVRHGLQGH
jgi:DNA-binding CsgD family transcriptional regulator